ncbi:tyrosinase family oxidase copper chaperone [Streptomyces sp. NPDC087903]|uniref:tyrosinase family oxidase copper chaperone n=1 Tax=Streptomyces sp. NPDC087903 TaxID=3365819 RepID=UPI003825119C
MVVSVSAGVSAGVGAVPVDTELGDTGRGRPAHLRGTRRDALRGLVGSAVAVALAPALASSRPPGLVEPPADLAFDETHLGRRIQGRRTAAGRTGGGRWQVTVDGRPLHLMRRADGTWLSMVDHYRSYPTALEATRAAVDELGPGQRLRDPGGAGAGSATDLTGGGQHHMGGHHGVHP